MGRTNSEGRPLTVLVTGASSGIGEAFARLLGRDRHNLILTARRENELHRVSGVISAETGDSPLVLGHDLTEKNAGEMLKQELDARGVEPEVVINNAGYGLYGHAKSLSIDEQLGICDLNVRAVTDLSLRFLPAMIRRGSGGLLNVSSVAAFLPGPYMAAYFASKAYIVSWSEALATELKGTGVTVTALCPGPVPTGFQARAGMDADKVYRGVPKITAAQCALAGWEAFKRGERVAFPDASSALSSYTSRHMPRRILLPIVGKIHEPKQNR